MKREDLVTIALSQMPPPITNEDHARLDIAVFILQNKLKDQIEGPLYEFNFPPTADEATQMMRDWIPAPPQEQAND